MGSWNLIRSFFFLVLGVVMMQFIFVQRRSCKSMTWFIVCRETQAEYEISRQQMNASRKKAFLRYLFLEKLLQKCILLVINWWIRRLDSRSNRVRIWKRTSDKDSCYVNGHDFTDIYMCIKVEVKSIMGYTRGVSWLWMIFWLSKMVMDLGKAGYEISFIWWFCTSDSFF